MTQGSGNRDGKGDPYWTPERVIGLHFTQEPRSGSKIGNGSGRGGVMVVQSRSFLSRSRFHVPNGSKFPKSGKG